MMKKMGRTKRKRKRKSVPDDSHDDTKIIELLQWLGISTHLQLHHFKDTGRGLRTQSRLTQGDLLISIPIHKMITRHSLQQNSNNSIQFDEKIPRKYPEHWSTQLMLSCFLMQELSKKPTSQWQIYLETLPRTYDVPYFDCPPQVLFHLPRHLKALIQAQFQLIDTRFSELVKFSKFSTKAKKLFSWAWFTANTRGVYFEDNHDNLALAPFLDMFNHHSEVEIEAIQNDGFYHLKALSHDTSKYQQVFINYGPHDNVKLYVEYGFVVPGNVHDCVSLTLEDLVDFLKLHKKSDLLLEKKIHFIQKYHLDEKLHLVKTAELASWSLLASFFILDDKNEDFERVFEQDLMLKSFKSQLRSISDNLSRIFEEIGGKLKLLDGGGTVLSQLIDIQLEIVLYVQQNLDTLAGE